MPCVVIARYAGTAYERQSSKYLPTAERNPRIAPPLDNTCGAREKRPDVSRALAVDSQAMLLRVIQTGEFVMVVGSQPQRVNVRIITATNRDLRQAVAKGVFREDLYFRIAVVHIAIPPLRERRKDIPLLVSHFLREFMASGHRKDIRGLTSRAMTALTNYSWPGNVRQ